MPAGLHRDGTHLLVRLAGRSGQRLCVLQGELCLAGPRQAGEDTKVPLLVRPKTYVKRFYDIVIEYKSEIFPSVSEALPNYTKFRNNLMMVAGNSLLVVVDLKENLRQHHSSRHSVDIALIRSPNGIF